MGQHYYTYMIVDLLEHFQFDKMTSSLLVNKRLINIHNFTE